MNAHEADDSFGCCITSLSIRSFEETAAFWTTAAAYCDCKMTAHCSLHTYTMAVFWQEPKQLLKEYLGEVLC